MPKIIVVLVSLMSCPVLAGMGSEFGHGLIPFKNDLLKIATAIPKNTHVVQKGGQIRFYPPGSAFSSEWTTPVVVSVEPGSATEIARQLVNHQGLVCRDELAVGVGLSWQRCANDQVDYRMATADDERVVMVLSKTKRSQPAKRLFESVITHLRILK